LTDDPLRARLAEVGRPDRAVFDAAYLKSDLHHLGVAVPDLRRVGKAWLRETKPDHEALFVEANRLWAAEVDGIPVYDCRSLAVELVTQSPDLLSADDLRWVEARLRQCDTWALVDPLGGWIAAGIVARDPSDGLAVLDRWVRDPVMWVRRSSLLGLRALLRDGRSRDRLYRYSEQLLPEREFFIRKVVGWVLREEAARRPGEVAAWLEAHMADMNLVTLREPMRKLDQATAGRLRAAYDTRR
jgi:3-methyladenine DNA glycosylase AlkD